MVFIVRTSGKTDSGPQTTMRPRPSDRLRIVAKQRMNAIDSSKIELLLEGN